MNSGSLFLLAIFLPVFLGATLLLPIYVGIFAAAYIVYTPAEGASPLSDKFLDVFYIVDAYSQLLSHWLANKAALSFVGYTLPVVGLPLACTAFALWLTVKIARKFLDVFHGFTSGN